MAMIRLYPDELCEVARYLRYLGGDVDHIHQCVRASWSRLDSGWEGYSSDAIVESYEQVCRMLSNIGQALYQCAWALEAAVSWIEEADRQSAAGFLALAGAWETGLPPITGPMDTSNWTASDVSPSST